ncbi:N-acetylglucosamine-6-phosphate deacetylase [Paenibacillus sp. GCM10028914]|uniref:N-acetylglucosamine-6-phosphate deacetylase n=1 Tax=Paenibacillus sp. GCM10028914 TaxID=3273416 RepID=UPI003619663D
MGMNKDYSAGQNLDIIDAKILTGHESFERGVLQIRGGLVEEILSLEQWERSSRDSLIPVNDASGRTLIPGLVDVHVHGGGGFDVMSRRKSDLEGMSLFHASRGTTSFLATTLTAGHNELIEAVRVVGECMQEGTSGAQIAGIHLEGPYLNKIRCGAQNPEHIRNVNLEEIRQYWDASQGQIKLITLAPEHEQAEVSTRWLTERGVTVSVGHSDADFETVRKIVSAGASHATHLFNGMRPLHHREPGVAGASLMLNEITVELIADGIHVHPEWIKYVWSTKGSEKVVMVTDCIGQAGMMDGTFDFGGLPAMMVDGIAYLRLEDGSAGSLAGSTLSLEKSLRNFLEWTGLPLKDLLPAYTSNPARQAGCLSHKGTLSPGKDADFLLLGHEGKLEETWVRGRKVYSRHS